jgi:hypothetical protein
MRAARCRVNRRRSERPRARISRLASAMQSEAGLSHADLPGGSCMHALQIKDKHGTKHSHGNELLIEGSFLQASYPTGPDFQELSWNDSAAVFRGRRDLVSLRPPAQISRASISGVPATRWARQPCCLFGVGPASRRPQTGITRDCASKQRRHGRCDAISWTPGRVGPIASTRPGASEPKRRRQTTIAKVSVAGQKGSILT